MYYQNVFYKNEIKSSEYERLVPDVLARNWNNVLLERCHNRGFQEKKD